MKHQRPDQQTLGADVRALRKARGLTLRALSSAVGRSVGWLSQVERDLSEPGIEDLKALAQVLDVSVSSLFSQKSLAGEEGLVVRAGTRRPIGSRESGLVEELLSPDLTDAFEMLHSTFEPGAELQDFAQRPTQEVGYILSGHLTLIVEDRTFRLGPGDSFRVRGERFRWANPWPDPCKVIWVIAPPVY